MISLRRDIDEGVYPRMFRVGSSVICRGPFLVLRRAQGGKQMSTQLKQEQQQPSTTSRIDRYFQLTALGTSVRTELIAGFTTFLAMAYILFVNPNILGAAGMDTGAVFVATGLVAVVGSLTMGLLANYPIAIAPGMGLNAFFAYSVVIGMGIPWQTALSGVLVSGLFFIVLTLSGIRETIVNAIPAPLKMAVAAGIGFFIAFIGLKNAGIVVASEATLVSLGSLGTGTTLLAVFGLVVSALLMARDVKGGIFIGMLLTAIVGMIFGLVPTPTAISDVVSMPPSMSSTFGQAFINFGDVFTLQMLVVILTFFFIDFFDTAGTLVAVARQAGIMKENKVPRASKALLADSTATVAGAIFGTSTATSYVESSAGVAAGGRTGLTAVFAGLFFGLALFFSPLLAVVTAPVTAPALIIVGVLMASALLDIDWKKIEIAVPAFLTIIMMPLTSSIATGIGLGFILYPLMMIAKGKTKEIHPIMYGMLVIFLAYFMFLPHA